jgi:hypothetical protein
MKPSFQIYGLFPKKTKYVWPNYLDNVTVTPVGLIAAPYCEFSTMFTCSNNTAQKYCLGIKHGNMTVTDSNLCRQAQLNPMLMGSTSRKYIWAKINLI